MGGCCGTAATYGIDPEQIPESIKKLRGKYGSDLLIMSVKDQNYPGKLCLTGNVDPEMVKEMTQVLKADQKNREVEVKKDKYDQMWETVWLNTAITTGAQYMSFTKNYFPRGKLFVKLLDTIAKYGWGLSACPNFGGVSARDDKGNVTETVDWPIFVFYKEPESQYTGEHLLLAVKDSNIPGKLCAAGPVGDLEGKMEQTLKQFAPDVKSEKDSYDEDFDVVWRNTKITSGVQMMSFAKKYFPLGKTNVALLQCAYSAGWRCVGAPNFGGSGDSWPCYILRKLKVETPPPELLLAAIKDSNIPGKLCISGPSADRVTNAVCRALTQVADNQAVHSEKDSYDDDHDAVCRDVKITTGCQAFSFRAKYYPRGDAMKTVLNAFQAEGYQTACCPNFGGMLDSWPTFVLEKRDSVPQQMYLSVKDENLPGKIGLVGGDAASDPQIGADLLEVLRTLCGPDVVQQQDDYDKTYDLAFRNTVLTTGHKMFTFSKPWWPHGYVLEMILQVLLKKGWKAQGGPNFGDDGGSWPGIIFSKVEV